MRKFPKPFFRPARQLWYVQLNGRQINLGPDKDEAYRHYHQLMLQRGTDTSSINPPPANPTAGELVLPLIEAFLGWCEKNKAPRTYEWYVAKCSSFARTISRTLTVEQLRPFHVHNWVDAHPKWAPGMKRGCMTAVQRVFNWAVKQGRIESNPIRHLEKPTSGRREVILRPAEFNQILRLARSEQFRDVLTVCWETGCRPQEIVRVEPRHLDLANNRWIFPPEESKGKRRHRVVYLTPTALEITRRLLLNTADGPIFRNREGQPWHCHAVACAFGRIQIALGREEMKRLGIVVSEGAIDDLVADLRKRGKDQRRGKRLTDGELRGNARRRLHNQLARQHASKYCLYHLRHSWATRALERGVDAVTVAVLMGHTDTRMLTQVYQHLSQNPTHLQNAVDKVNKANEK